MSGLEVSVGARRLSLVILAAVITIATSMLGPAVARAQALVLGSTASDGTKADGSSYLPILSADGSHLVFVSEATNLHPRDSDPRFTDVYAKNLETGELLLVSDNDGLTKPVGDSTAPSVSGDGGIVAFHSTAALDPIDTNGTVDVYVRDLHSETVALVTALEIGGVRRAVGGSSPSVSADGQRIAFSSRAAFVTGDTNGTFDVFVKDLGTDEVWRASESSDGTLGDGESGGPALSDDGSVVAFVSQATNLDPLDQTDYMDIYVKDLRSGILTLITGDDGPDGQAGAVALSGDGTRVAFETDGAGLSPDDMDNRQDIFMYDMVTTEMSLISRSLPGRISTGDSFQPHISPDGRFVAFTSDDTTLHPDDDDAIGDVYVADLDQGVLHLLSLGESGQKSNALSSSASVATTGRVAFGSYATNLLVTDTDALSDVYLTSLPATDPDADGDGVDDSIDTGNGTFTHGATSGSISNAAGHRVTVAPEGSDEVRIIVVGSGTAPASVEVCGFSMQLVPGSEVVVSCGSVTIWVLSGSVELVLGDGLTRISLAAGVRATVEHHPDGSYAVTDVSGGSVTVTVDGVSATVSPGQSLTLQVWDFVGFRAPVDNGDVLNVVRAGQSVPLKWRILDADGMPVADLGSARVTVTSLACNAGLSADQLEETASGTSGLQNLGEGYYQFNWKTPKSYANSCKVMRLDIGDGVLHAALFRFTK